MLVNKSVLTSIHVGFKTLFNKTFQAAKPMWDKVATLIPSATKSEEYKWIGKLPRLREWIGERQIQNLTGFGYTIKNKDWEATVSVERNDIEDDSIGVYNPIIQELANSAAIHPDEIVFGLLPGGFTNLCYDGQYFFDEDHKDGDGLVQSNKGAKVLSPTSYGTARAGMMSLLDDKGKPLGVIPNLLVVPPQLEEMGRKILLADIINNETNTYKGSAELLVVPWLAAHPTKWFLLDTSKPVKPLIFQQRKKPEFVAKDKIDDDNVFFNKEFVYGTDCRDNAGYGLWQLAYGSTGTEA